MSLHRLVLLVAATAACGETGANAPIDGDASDAQAMGDVASDVDTEDGSRDAEFDAADVIATSDVVDAGIDTLDAANDIAADVAEGSGPTFRVVTFNTGTGLEMAHDSAPDDGYSRASAQLTDEWYGNGLAWTDFVSDTRVFFETVDADIVVFQEIFASDDCAEIPEDARDGFVCEDWQAGDPTVAQRVLGDGWQVICHMGKPDKCLGVNRRFGTFRGCDADYCAEGAGGFRVDGCGSGSRIGRGVIERGEGLPPITVINVHGSSGFNASDSECRERQFDQIFVDFGDGEPAANGVVNLILGDFNTDPARLNPQDSSAARLAEFVGADLDFDFLSAVGRDATPTYAGLFNIDHVVADALIGTCSSAGVEPPWPAPTDAVFFDHSPLVCDVQLRAPR